MPLLKDHLRRVSYGYPITVSDDYSWVIVRSFKLPPGFNRYSTEVLVKIPSDYPLSPPGIGSARVYLPKTLRFNGREMYDLHPNTGPGWGDWAWFCYEHIRWDPNRDNLVKTLEMIRADLTSPKTK